MSNRTSLYPNYLFFSICEKNKFTNPEQSEQLNNEIIPYQTDQYFLHLYFLQYTIEL